MGSYVLDSILFKDWYGTERARKIFSDENTVQKWMDVEAALAKAQGDLGIIPAEAASEISGKASVSNLDLERLKEKIAYYEHPLVPFINEFKAICAGAAGQYVHYGTTTQDIMDTAMVLQIKEIHGEVVKNLRAIQDNCKRIAANHRHTLMAGRTHGQQALPITLGFKAAVWASEIGRAVERMEECEKRAFTGQLSGAAGTLAGIEENPFTLTSRVMRYLDLNEPDISWHSSRDRFAEFITVMGIISASVARIANEIYQLQKTEFSELAEPWKDGKVSSSTMPHKRNPSRCARIVALSKIVRCNVPLALECMVSENERDLRVLATEWHLIGQICMMTDAAVLSAMNVTEGLVVRPKEMERNLGRLNGLMMSERLMFIVGKKIGRVTAHEIIQKICMEAFENGEPLAGLLMKNEVIREAVSLEEINAALDPQTYTGHCDKYIDNICDN